MSRQSRLPSVPFLRWILLAVVAVGAATATRATDEAAKQSAESDAKERAAYVRTMRIMAEEFKIIRQTDDSQARCKMVKESVLNWTDQARHPDLIIPGTTWIWHHNGRPQFIGEIYGRVDSIGQWNVLTCALSGDRLSFSDGLTKWTAMRSYYDPKEIPRASVPAETKVSRTIQMSRLARRFDAHEFWEGRFELRLLSRPVYRYQDTDAGIIDGAVYALVHGTNPEVLVLIEAHATDDDPARWKVGFGSLAGARCVVRLDGEEFWTCSSHKGDPADPRQVFSKAVPVVGLDEAESQ